MKNLASSRQTLADPNAVIITNPDAVENGADPIIIPKYKNWEKELEKTVTRYADYNGKGIYEEGRYVIHDHNKKGEPYIKPYKYKKGGSWDKAVHQPTPESFLWLMFPLNLIFNAFGEWIDKKYDECH